MLSNFVATVGADGVYEAAAASKPKTDTHSNLPSHFVVSRTGLATSVQAGLVSVLEQTGLVRAVLMQACLRVVHNAVRRALHVALDAAPCRTSAPERRWLEQRSPTQPRIPERRRSFDARSFPIRFFPSCPTTLLDFDRQLTSGGHLPTTLIQIKYRRSDKRLPCCPVRTDERRFDAITDCDRRPTMPP